MLNHRDYLDSQRLALVYLPVDPFKRKLGVSNGDRFYSLPNAIRKFRKGRRDILRLALEAAERSDGYSAKGLAAPPASPGAASSLSCGRSGKQIACSLQRFGIGWNVAIKERLINGSARRDREAVGSSAQILTGIH